MNGASRILLTLIVFMALPALAQVEWNEPEVVPEKLMRHNRRVLRFTGVTKPGAQLRVRNNKVKVYLDGGDSRWSNIPQKNRIQFPVVADDSGEFSFDLYLPTSAVEIPIEIYKEGKWVPYTLNFRVPMEGAANDFQAVEESFRDDVPGDDMTSKIDKNSDYKAKDDQGLYVQDRDRRGPIARKSPVEFYGGMGISYYSIGTANSTVSPSYDVSESALVIPSFRVGLNYDVNEKIDVRVSLRSSSGSIDAPAGVSTTGTDFNWLEVQASGLYYFKSLGGGMLGFDGGLQMQSIPLFRQRTGFADMAYYDNNVYAVHVGLNYQSSKSKVWPWEVYGRYLYAFSSGDAYSIESGFPLMFEFGGGVRKRLTPGLSLGFYSQLEYFSFDVAYDNTGTSSFSTMLLTGEVRLIANF
ncbi:MAG: hypothetical protein KDD33_09785 [Bdellovibrionales bacterium]|nr:hypothetical protein [Bdellovibrionales bacterium]